MVEQTGQVMFRILGPLEVWDGKQWEQVRPSKWRTLMAVLLLRAGQQVSTDEIMAEVWEDRPPATATNLVRVYVHHLRRLIGDEEAQVLLTRGRGYTLVLAAGGLDAENFAALVASGGAALSSGDAERASSLLNEALALWRGRALADVEAGPLVSAEADRLEEARLAALALRAEADLACGRHMRAAPELRRLLADHPLREELWLLLMRALAGAGRQAAALEAYDQARRVIADELGVDPSPSLQQLYQQILSAEPGEPAALPAAPIEVGASPARGVGVPAAAAAAFPVPAQLPADITDFTGRTAQVAELSGLLLPDVAVHGDMPIPGDVRTAPGRALGDDGPGKAAGAYGTQSPGAVRVVLVVGSGGLGKTTLAVHASHLVAAQFPDGQLFAHLAGATHPVDPGEVLARFLRDLGMEPARIPVAEEERAAAYRTRLAGKRVLIVLDDARDTAQVAPLLPGSASCAVLITARGQFPDLPSAHTVDLDVLAPAESAALFARIAGQARVAAEPQATGQVLAACAGLPLATRIAGGRLATRAGWSVSTLAARLADEHRRLDELRAGNLAVRACFEVSFASLPAASPGGEDPVHAFRLLGLWAGPPLSLAAAAALLGRQDEASTADALEVLIDAHLLESPEPDRYRFHDLLRVFAADRARTQETPQACQAAITRLLTWYLHTTEGAARVISPQHARVSLGAAPAGVVPVQFTSLTEALAWCETERASLIAAARLADSAGALEMAWQIPAAAMSFYYRRSHWTDWVTTHRIGLTAARALGDRAAEAWMLNNLGMAYGDQRQEQAIACFDQALAICREIGDSPCEARVANNIANAYLDSGRYEQALVAAEQSLVIQQRVGRTYAQGLARGLLGEACCELARYAEAVHHSQEALAIFRSLGSRDAEADALSDLGDALLGLGAVADAIVHLRESLQILRDVGDRHGECATLRRLAQALRCAGDVRQAHQLLVEALTVLEELGDRAGAADVRRDLAELDEKAC